MSMTTARMVEAWELVDRDCQDVVERQTIDNVTGLYSAKHYVLQIRRALFQVSSLGDETGMMKSIFSLASGGNFSVQWSAPGRKFRCTTDRIRVLDQVTGEAEQVQVWEHYSTPELIPFSEFAEEGG